MSWACSRGWSSSIVAGGALAIAISGCGGHALTPAATQSRSTLSTLSAAPLPLTGYWDTWQQKNLAQTPSRVTTIPIAFGYLHGHTISLQAIPAGYVTAADIAALHARGVKVTLSLGGWSPQNAFVFDGNVAGFEASLKSVLAALPFDGVDFDEEHGTQAQRVKDLTTLIPATRKFFTGIGKPGAIVTSTAWNLPTDYGDDAILKNANVVGAISWVNVMSYEHRNVAQTEADLKAYSAIFDKSRLEMGVDIDDAPIPPVASLQTLSSWVRANGYGGMMAWTVNSISPQQLQALTGQ